MLAFTEGTEKGCDQIMACALSCVRIVVHAALRWLSASMCTRSTDLKYSIPMRTTADACAAVYITLLHYYLGTLLHYYTNIIYTTTPHSTK